MKKALRNIFLLLPVLTALFAMAVPASAQRFNDKLQNRPYADLRRWHLGFSIGVHTQDINFTHNGLLTEDGHSWYMEHPSFSPGFCVNGLFDLRLNEWFNLRVSPGMYFGNRDVTIVDVNTVENETPLQYRQNIKTAYLVAPIDLKFSGQRYRNCRPYLTGGVMPAFNLTRKQGDYLRLKSSDFYLTLGLGFDFYLPFFKFNPEVKFCFGLTDVIDHKRTDLADDPQKFQITQSLTKARSNMVVLTFYFE
ncbi:MAG: PorT family protein [Firmicutes bacterium]|nr:PorT family protein [Bacillota bacterium]MCM1401000.1 PorT family protein [Bacteroides sp.]MCM1476527.1 PorT family protein [Bacteroides sp.]